MFLGPNIWGFRAGSLVPERRKLSRRGLLEIGLDFRKNCLLEVGVRAFRSAGQLGVEAFEFRISEGADLRGKMLLDDAYLN